MGGDVGYRVRYNGAKDYWYVVFIEKSGDPATVLPSRYHSEEDARDARITLIEASR